ncbi:MAG TPA: oxygen-dependent coproporphyrinogen oxidase [Candidatus Acidoferrales bacterium]|nr:oxygen-dependent coproporphyrinogen oxidase [Candidatus Acidoferrales bacterium]
MPAFSSVDWDRAASLVEEIQSQICERVAAWEPDVAFAVDDWKDDGSPSRVAGRGSTRVIAGGRVFERGGVNTSIVTGTHLPPSLVAQRPELARCSFLAAGVSVVLHPLNPYVPTTHCNYRYFEARSQDGAEPVAWFGGGADLTPYYPVLEDVRHFHAALRAACDRHDPAFYPAFKAWCDDYFFLRHRGETRGVGGIFYDYLDERGYGPWDARTPFAVPRPAGANFAFVRDAGRAFLDAYFPLVERRASHPYGERERSFQLLRRGRYVEFNLIYDRGTQFGLQSGGRTEAILMSLPPLVRWAYDERPQPGSPEAALAAYLQPRDWFAPDPFEGSVPSPSSS